MKGFSKSLRHSSVLFGLLLLMFTHCVLADSSKDLECVQKQLTKLAEREVLIELNELANIYHDIRLKNTYLRLPETLTERNAVIACRLFGREYNHLKAHWPGLKKRIEVYTAEHTNPALIQQTTELVLQAMTKNVDKNGIRFVRTIPIVVGSSIKDLEVFAKQNMGELFNPTVFDEVAIYVCDTHLEIVGGFIYGKSIYICFEDENEVFSFANLRIVDYEGIVEKRSLIEMLIIHELFHIYQREVIGYDVRLDSLDFEDEQLPLPVWFVEGTAIIAGYLAYHERFKLPQSELDRLEALIDVPLSKMESSQSYEQYGNNLYEQGAAASIILLDEFGKRSIEKFMSFVGLGEAWPIAFEKSFGMTPNEFYQRFSKH